MLKTRRQGINGKKTGKKLLLGGIAMMMGFSLAGCSGKDVAAETKTEQTNTELPKGTIHTSEPDDREIAEKVTGEVLDALERQDVSKLEELFSDYARKNTSDLEAQIKALIEAYPGLDGEYEGNCNTHEESNRGKKMYVLNTRIDVPKAGKYCSINICYVKENTEDSSMPGIYLIQLLSDPDHAPEGFFWHDQEDEPGAFVENGTE